MGIYCNTNISKQQYISRYVYIYIYICTYIRTHTHTCVIYIHIYMCVYIYIYIYITRMYMYTHTHTPVSSFWGGAKPSPQLPPSKNAPASMCTSRTNT